MPPSPSHQYQDAPVESAPQKDNRSPQRAAIIAVLLAAETAVCTQAGSVPSASAVAAPAAAASLAPVRRPGMLDALDDETRRKVCSYLSWRDCLKLKPLSKQWNSATEEVVMLETLPDAPAPTAAVFLPCPSGVVEDTQMEVQLRCQHPSKWRCVACGFCNSETRILCGNRACQIPCPTHADCARLFVGQLRREGTVPMLKWLLETVFGSLLSPVSIVNVENHRQLTTSRGKGCAWVYLQHRAMADTVLQFNHRVFTDVHPTTGREGVWIVARGDETALQESVKVRGYVRGRDLVLPRNAIVVEFPSRQPNQPSSWDATQHGAAPQNMPPSYAAAAAAAAATSGTHNTTPEANWYPATDSPPSESSTEMPNSSSPTPTMRSRRNQPYGSSCWTPTTAVSPALAGDFPPSMSSGCYFEAPTEYEPSAYYTAASYGAYPQQQAQGYHHHQPHHGRGYRRGQHHHHAGVYQQQHGYYYGQAVPVYQGASF